MLVCYKCVADRISDNFNPQNLIVGVGKNSDGKATICYALQDIPDNLVARDVYCDEDKALSWDEIVLNEGYNKLVLFVKSLTEELQPNADLPTDYIMNAVDVYAEKRVIAYISQTYELCVQSYTHDSNSVTFDPPTCEPLADKLDCNYRALRGSGYAENPNHDPTYDAPDENNCKTGYAVKFSADKTHILVGLIPDGINNVDDDENFVLFQRFKVTFNTAENSATESMTSEGSMEGENGDGGSPGYSTGEPYDSITENEYQAESMPESSLSDTDIPFSKRPPQRRRRDTTNIFLAPVNTDQGAAKIEVADGDDTAKTILFDGVRQTPDGAINAFIQADDKLAFKRIGSDTTCTFKDDYQCIGPAVFIQHLDDYILVCPGNKAVINLSKGDKLEDANGNVCTFPVSISKPVYFSRPEPQE